MRILQVISHYVPAYRFGGPLQVAHNLGRALVDQGHTVTVVTTNLADEENLLDIPVDHPIIQDGVIVFYESVKFLRYWGFSPGLWRRVSQEIMQADFVLIHAHYQFANWAGAYLARKHKKPYIIFAHGSLHLQGISSKHYWAKRIYLKLMEDENFQKARFIAFNAPEEHLNSLYQAQGRVIYSGISPSDFEPLPSSEYFLNTYPELQNKRYLLFLGRLDIEQKGLDLLLPAFAQLVAQYPDTHLVLAGPDEDDNRQKLQKMLAQLNIEQFVTFTGLVSGNDKLALLQHAYLFTMPSRFEGLSIALLEALYLGIPVLTTNRVGLSTEIENMNAGVVVDFTLSDIYQGLVKTDKIESIRGNGTKLVREKYAWDGIARQLIEAIQAAS